MKNSIKGLILTILLLPLAVILTGGGHGYFEPLIFLFPFAALGFLIVGKMNLAFIILGLSQFSIYGYLLDRQSGKIKLTVLVIIIFHLTLSAIIYYSNQI